MIVDVLVRAEVIDVSSQAGSFIGASAAFVVGIIVAFVGVAVHPGRKPTTELVRAHLGDLERESSAARERSPAEDAGWYRLP